MKVHSYNKEYEYSLEENSSFLQELVNIKEAVYCIDKNVYSIYSGTLLREIPEKKICLIEAVERSKSIETALQICERVMKLQAKKNATIIAIGGGIIQDITGFAACVLYRGIYWTFVPTTLLSACDSCIGGKTSLNYNGFKNLLGTFYAPDRIYLYPQWFDSLSDLDYYSGLGEVVKFHLMQGEPGVERLEAVMDKLLTRDRRTINESLINSLEYKKRFIEEDEFDKGIRAFLNYGHTFGHAFEAASDYVIPHGTAVAMGIVAANYVSVNRGFLDKEKAQRMDELLKPIIPPIDRSSRLPMERIVESMKKDKKRTGEGITIVVLRGGYKEDMDLQLISDVSENEAMDAVKYLFNVVSGVGE